jgi:hypothetical protein
LFGCFRYDIFVEFASGRLVVNLCYGMSRSQLAFVLADFASGRFCGDFTVARIEMPSVADFDRNYACIGKPVVITNLLEQTDAARKWAPTT